MTDSHDRHDQGDTYEPFVASPGEREIIEVNFVSPAEMRAQLDRERAAGYAQAVANALDDDRFVAWLAAQPFDDRWRAIGPGRPERRRLADYLEAVGPGADALAAAFTVPPPQVGREMPERDRLIGQLIERDVITTPEQLSNLLGDSLGAPESGRDRSTHPDLPDEGRTGRDGETAGRDEAGDRG